MILLPKAKGRQLGQIIVYGDDAVPIVYSRKPEQVVLAAVELGQGQGRIIVMSHHNYLDGFGTKQDQEHLAILHENINHWVTKGAFANADQIVDLKDISEFAEIDPEKHKILVWNSWKDASPSFQDEIIDYIVTGGALVYALSPVKWKAKFSHMSMENVPLGTVLKRAGLGFSHHKVPYSDEKGITIDLTSQMVPDSLALIHLRHLIQNCTTETNGQNLRAHAKVFVQFFQDVPPHIVEYMKDKLYTLFAKCNEVIHMHVPDPELKITNPRAIACLSICGVLSELQLGYTKVPGVKNFPGDFEEDSQPSLQCSIIEIKSDSKQAHTTGYYVPAGGSIQVKIISEQSALEEVDLDEEEDFSETFTSIDDMLDEWFIRIGSHSDSLHHKDALLRWPNLMIKVPIKSNTSVSTPYGGLLYIMSPNKSSKITLQVSGIVEAPSFDLRNPVTAENWDTIKTAPGLWTDISGHWFRITVPSSSVRDLINPTELMQVWDQVILANHDLRGTKPHRREWLVTDVQPVVGKAHSGYPLVSHMNMAEPDGVLNLTRLSTIGFWGMFHELGHNMQRNMWTFEGTREVTCNIFTLHAVEKVSKQRLWLHDWLMKQMPKIENYLQSGAEFSEWQSSSGIGLGFYAQLAHNFGWQSYQKVFRGYEVLPINKRPTTNQEKIDHWVQKFSEAVNHNICPMVDFWGIPISQQAEKKIGSLSPFLPNDEMTAFAPDRVRQIEERYPHLLREVDKDKLKEKHWCPLV